VDVAGRVKGWCPVHDRVFESADGACPECGTPLIAPERRTHAGPIVAVREDAEDFDAHPVEVETEATRSNARTEPVQVGVAAIAIAAAIVVAGAFFLGVAITRGRGTGTAPVGVPKARADYEVRAARRGAGVELRLDGFAQRGRDVVVRVTVPAQPDIETAKISSVVVVPLTAGGEALGRARLGVRATTTGFMAAGRAVRDARTPITGIEIVSVTQDVSLSVGLLPVDLSRVWPVAAGGSPRATEARATARSPDGRRYTLTGIVGWPDRVEAGMTVSGDRAGWAYDEAFSLVFEQKEPALGKAVDSPQLPGVRHVVFKGLPSSLPAGARHVGMQIVVNRVTIPGNWRWMFT
jgi:hypothetical protein